MAQAGQDFWVYSEVFDQARDLFYVDVGAHDGVEFSNTYLLDQRYGWNGICVEANPETFQQLVVNRPLARCVNACVHAKDGEAVFVKDGMHGGIAETMPDAQSTDRQRLLTVSFERVLRENNAPPEIDYLSMDIEGAEESVLLGFSFDKYLFRCATIERPSMLLREELRRHGYIVVKELPGLDCFYVHESFLAQYQQNFYQFYGRRHLALLREVER